VGSDRQESRVAKVISLYMLGFLISAKLAVFS
jgi:hypothetical protein